MGRLVDQIREALAAFVGLKTRPALIGGLALAAHQVVRGTRDVDFLVDADDAEQLHALLLGLGYHCIHRSADAANYLRGDEGIDLLYAHRPEARRLLFAAQERDTGMGRLRVISAEGLTQISSPAPPKLASPVDAWVDLMEVIEALCPRWPPRPLSVGRDYRL